MATAGDPNRHASSTGQTMTGAAWLDNHFESNRPEYEAQVRAVGIQPGWHVLDAGCGGGNFLPWLADLVGSSGKISALDLALDNIAVVEARLADWRLTMPTETRTGSLLALPYPDDTFDVVWCANTTQYLNNDELRTALAELRRVVRPGGLVAVKDTDWELTRMLPAPPALLLHWIEARARAGDEKAPNNLRSPDLPAWLRRAGLVAVWRRMTLIERAAPMARVSRDQCRSFLAYCSGLAADLDLPDADRRWWAKLNGREGLDGFVNGPELYTCEGNILAVGQVPTSGGQ